MRLLRPALLLLVVATVAAPGALATASLCVQHLCVSNPTTEEACTRHGHPEVCVPGIPDPFENCFTVYNRVDVGPVYYIQSGCGTAVGVQWPWCVPPEFSSETICFSRGVPL